MEHSADFSGAPSMHMPDNTNSNDNVERRVEKRRKRETALDTWSRIGDRFGDKLLDARAARLWKGKEGDAGRR